MIIHNIKDAHNKSYLSDKDFIVDNLLPQVDDICDCIIDKLLHNDNVEMKASFGYDLQTRCITLCFNIVNNPISQEENIEATLYIKNKDILNRRL